MACGIVTGFVFLGVFFFLEIMRSTVAVKRQILIQTRLVQIIDTRNEGSVSEIFAQKCLIFNHEH